MFWVIIILTFVVFIYIFIINTTSFISIIKKQIYKGSDTEERTRKLKKWNQILSSNIQFSSSERKSILSEVLHTFCYSDQVCFYIAFGYHQEEENNNWKNHIEKYNDLEDNHGVIKLQKTDFFNIELISDLFCEFQVCLLFANEIQNMDELYDFTFLRLEEQRNKWEKTIRGYQIRQLEDSYIELAKQCVDYDYDPVWVRVNRLIEIYDIQNDAT